MPKAPLIEEEALGPGTSDAASDVESDIGDVEGNNTKQYKKRLHVK